MLGFEVLAATPAPFIVDFRQPVRIESVDSIWTIVAALAGAVAAAMSAAVALATLKLANDTARLARQTYAATTAEETRHHERLRPHLSLTVQETAHAESVGTVARVRERKAVVEVKNIGVGPAEKICVKQGMALLSSALPPALGTGDTTQADLTGDAASGKLLVEYSDAFGTRYASSLDPVTPGTQYDFNKLGE